MDEQSVIPYQPDSFFGGDKPAVWSSFETPEESAAALMEAGQLADHIGEVFQLANVVAHWVTIDGGDKGMLIKQRTIIVDKDGQSLSCVSDGVKNALSIVFGLKGRPPFNPPLPVKIVQLKAKVGHVLSLVVQINKPTQPKGKGK